MARQYYLALKGLLLIVAIYHIALGLLGIFAKNLAVALARNFFNFNLALTDQIYWIINPFATYVLIFGFFMAVAASDPIKYKKVVYVGVALCTVRVAQRLAFFFIAPEGLVNNIDPIRNIIAIIVVSSIGIALFVMTIPPKHSIRPDSQIG